MTNPEERAIKTYLKTRQTYLKRQKESVKSPDRTQYQSLLKAGFALSMARARVLRYHDKFGLLLMSANKDIGAAKQALSSCCPDTNVKQLSLF
jgi:hypothetical protein